VAGLLDEKRHDDFVAERRADQERLRRLHAARQEQPLLPLTRARANRLAIAWHQDELPAPAFLGRRAVAPVPLAELRDYIDWTFFFTAWELKGRVPQIFDHPQYGAEARDLFEQAQAMLDQVIADRSLEARAVYGFWPAAGDGDDVVLYTPADRSIELARFPMLRQQQVLPDDRPNRSLADFIAPAASGLRDHIGAFALTAGIGAEALATRFEAAHDDYRAIMVKALADRLAEACAEWLHARVRREWGYGQEERLTHEDLVAERYRGIRPAFGYPACPDHSETFRLFDLLDARALGLQLTESAAMVPAASVSGLFFSHPQAKYFTIGRIGADQVADYARRKGISVETAERWLSPNLAYDPAREAARASLAAGPGA
jgi:5-methyltetrahydrofolate--homocysteine methyltransferase